MTAHRDSPSRGARPPGRLRRSRASLLASGNRDDGILALVPHDPPRDAGAPSVDPMPNDARVAQLRAERDAAFEEIVFLKEQLRSVSAYHAHLLDQERARMRAERHALLHELALLGEELQRRSRRNPTVDRARGDGATSPAPPR